MVQQIAYRYSVVLEDGVRYLHVVLLVNGGQYLIAQKALHDLLCFDNLFLF